MKKLNFISILQKYKHLTKDRQTRLHKAAPATVYSWKYRGMEEINEIFDIISYRKGSSIIRMLFSYLGYETAFKGLASYLHKHALQNAETEDLWAALSAASGKPVATIMRRWTATSGYPYVAVSRAAGGGVALETRRFISAWARDPAAWPAAEDFAEGASIAAAAVVLVS